MAILDGVEVRIKLANSGNYLEEYDPPGYHAESSASRSCEKYIEAFTNQVFHVEVSLHQPGFHYHGARGIKIKLKLDDGSLIDHGRYESKPTIVRLHEMQKKQEPLVYTWKSTRIRNNTGYVQAEHQFGEIDINHEMEMNDDEVQERLLELGVIVCSIQRIKSSVVARRSNSTSKEPVTQAAKELVKGAQISHTARLANSESVRAPRSKARYGIPLNGPHGNPLEFRFRYRSKKSLELLGIIKENPQAHSSSSILQMLPPALMPAQETTETAVTTQSKPATKADAAGNLTETRTGAQFINLQTNLARLEAENARLKTENAKLRAKLASIEFRLRS